MHHLHPRGVVAYFASPGMLWWIRKNGALTVDALGLLLLMNLLKSTHHVCSFLDKKRKETAQDFTRDLYDFLSNVQSSRSLLQSALLFFVPVAIAWALSGLGSEVLREHLAHHPYFLDHLRLFRRVLQQVP